MRGSLVSPQTDPTRLHGCNLMCIVRHSGSGSVMTEGLPYANLEFREGRKSSATLPAEAMKMKLSLCLTKHLATKTHGRAEV
jgi:hypothetical protein